LNKDDAISILKLAQDQKLSENLNLNSDSDSELNLDCIKDLIERGYIQAISIKPKWFYSFPNRIAVISLIVAVIGSWFAVKLNIIKTSWWEFYSLVKRF
jgi:hypothetical protein